MHEGKHTPIVSKELFDRVQKVLAMRSRAQKPTKQPQVLCGLLKCGICGCSITGEVQTKKSGRRYVYYHCTKKRGMCAGEYIREDALASQLTELLARFTMPEAWAAELLRMAAEDETKAHETAASAVRTLRSSIEKMENKLARLTDLFIEQDIDRPVYHEKKAALMSEKRSAQEQVLRLEGDAASWIEPLRKWVAEASMLDEIRKNGDLPSKKSSLQKIFGSNLTLSSREARGLPQNPWFSLAHAKENLTEKILFLLWCAVRDSNP